MTAFIVPLLFVLAGFVLLTKGADYLIEGAVDLATRANISPLVVGLTVVAFGTSLPELVVCVQAALGGAPGIAIGNVVGSNIANVLLILGASALICRVVFTSNQILKESAYVIGASVLACLSFWTGTVERWHGALFFLSLVAYLVMVYLHNRKSKNPEELAAIGLDDMPEATTQSLPVIWAMVVGGLVGVALGGKLLVDGAIDVARLLNVPETVIGLTMIAVGTSLPELAAAIAAALKRHTDVILGNILGSNLFNILGVMGLTAVVSPIPVNEQVLRLDMWVMLAVAVVLLPFLFIGRDLNKFEGGLFLVLYCTYIGTQFV